MSANDLNILNYLNGLNPEALGGNHVATNLLS